MRPQSVTIIIHQRDWHTSCKRGARAFYAIDFISLRVCYLSLSACAAVFLFSRPQAGNRYQSREHLSIECDLKAAVIHLLCAFTISFVRLTILVLFESFYRDLTVDIHYIHLVLCFNFLFVRTNI